MDTVDVSADTTRVTLETIGRCATGYSFGCFRTETMHPFVEHMVEGLRGSDRLGVFRSTFLPRFIANYYERKVHRHAAHMHGIADEIIAARRKERPVHDDLLEIMLASDLDAANIRYQLINFADRRARNYLGRLSVAELHRTGFVVRAVLPVAPPGRVRPCPRRGGPGLGSRRAS